MSHKTLVLLEYIKWREILSITFVDIPDRQYRWLTSINNQKTIESWRSHTVTVKNIEVRDYVSSIPSGAVRL